MTNRSSTYMILLSLCCCYRISSSFSTTGHSFIKKHSPHHHQHQHQHTRRLTNAYTSRTSTTSFFTTGASIHRESRNRFYLATSDVNESDLDVNMNKEKEDNSSNINDLDIVSKIISPSDETNANTNTNTDTTDNSIVSQKQTTIEIEGIDNDSVRDDITDFSEDGLGAFDPSKKLPLKREVLVGDPQQKVKKEGKSVAEILTELAAIQKQGPQKYCILGSRHVSYLHQQIIELLSYALVLSENHVYTSGAMGTNAAAIRGALRAGRPDLLTVILPQSLDKQTDESQELLRGVTDLISMPQNDEMNLDVASRLCNSKLLSETDQLVAFAFHESKTVIEATKEAKKLEMLVTTLFLD